LIKASSIHQQETFACCVLHSRGRPTGHPGAWVCGFSRRGARLWSRGDLFVSDCLFRLGRIMSVPAQCPPTPSCARARVWYGTVIRFDQSWRPVRGDTATVDGIGCTVMAETRTAMPAGAGATWSWLGANWSDVASRGCSHRTSRSGRRGGWDARARRHHASRRGGATRQEHKIGVSVK